MRLLPLTIAAVALTLAGCSYSPARITPEPLIEIDGRDHRHHRSSRQSHHYYHYDDRRRGGFCPPGQRKKGRC
nr:hypothetical protein [Halomonas socia]